MYISSSPPPVEFLCSRNFPINGVVDGEVVCGVMDLQWWPSPIITTAYTLPYLWNNCHGIVKYTTDEPYSPLLLSLHKPPLDPSIKNPSHTLLWYASVAIFSGAPIYWMLSRAKKFYDSIPCCFKFFFNESWTCRDIYFLACISAQSSYQHPNHILGTTYNMH